MVLLMLSLTELKILKKLFDDMMKVWTIHEISLELKLPYPQTHRSMKSLLDKDLIIKTKKGKSSLIEINIKLPNDHFLTVENERKKDIKKRYKIINILEQDLSKIKYKQFICILFGSYADKNGKKKSDIDLLFIIPEEYNYSNFEREVKNKISLPRLDINITTEKGLLEMWYNPLKLNLGNEILKKHIALKGVEAFLNLRSTYYMGEN